MLLSLFAGDRVMRAWLWLLATIIVFATPLAAFTILPQLIHPRHCLVLSPLTRFVVPYLTCLIAAHAVKQMLRQAWPEAHLVGAKQREAIGDLSKAIARFAVLAHLLPLWSRMSFSVGLDVGTPCSPSRESFDGSRFLIAAVMAWELAFNPAVPQHVYVHHIFLLLLVVWGVDAAVLDGSWHLVGGSSAPRPSIVNGFVFLLLHVAVVGPPIKELFIIRYRVTPREDGRSRARWLKLAARCHVLLTLLTVLALPSFYLYGVSTAATPIGAGPIALGMSLVLCLALIELYSLRHLLLVARALSRRGVRPLETRKGGHEARRRDTRLGTGTREDEQPPCVPAASELIECSGIVVVVTPEDSGGTTGGTSPGGTSSTLSSSSDSSFDGMKEPTSLHVPPPAAPPAAPAQQSAPYQQPSGQDAGTKHPEGELVELTPTTHEALGEQELLAATFHARTTDPALLPLAGRLGNEEKLLLYALYKQATVGDCAPGKPRPRAFEVRARAKHDAWASRRGMEASYAMREYLALLERLSAK